jgi:DNA-binding CsgD family transcriptional regulator/PAS domain-containing protein
VSRDQLLSVIEAIHEAAVDEALWPKALEAATRLVGGVGATVEVAERSGFKHNVFYCWGVPEPQELAYLSHYAPLSPRFPPEVLRQRPGEVNWDYRVIDETGIEASVFYMEFLASLDMRYFVGGMLKTSPSEFGAFAIQRSARNGHVDRAEIALMRHLVPHVSRALDVTRRLRRGADARRSLEQAFDWIADGVVLLDAAARVTYVNQAFLAIARTGDGIGLREGRIEFGGAAARHRFAEALLAVALLRGGNPERGGRDFSVARGSEAPAYLVSVRPLAKSRDPGRCGDALTLVLVSDPLRAGGAASGLLREVFGLTVAEAGLAQALQSGTAASDYARTRGVSVNTVYTHLRRIKEKTGSHRTAELIRKLNDLRAPPLGDPVD